MIRLDYGVPTDKTALTVRLGIDKGFFRQEGIDLSVRVVYGGPQLAAAFDSGSLQFGEIGSPPAIVAIAHGSRFRIVGSSAWRKAHMYFGARPEIRSWEALRGKRVGLLSLGSCPEWFVRAMLVARGLDPDRHVTYVGLLDEYARIIEVMMQGRIDAGIMVEPNMSVGEAAGAIKMWGAVYDEPTLPQFQWMVQVARPDFIEREPDLIRVALRACRRSAHYAAAHVDELVDYGARLYAIPRATMERALRRELPHLHLDGQLDMQGLEAMIKVQETLRAISKPMKAADIANTELQPEVAEL